ncbi:MAG: polysaccharide export outer membrane protein [Halioglobus sp.]|jgi:polysaccharide export outer membrane protein
MFDLVNVFSRKIGRNTAVKAALLPLVLSVAACSSNSYPPVSDAQKSSGTDYSYVVGPGDTMEIFVWGNEELTTVGVVRPDGKFTTRLAEDMQASGKTSTELARDIEKAYAEYVKQPVVSVIINEFVGVPSQQVRVVGEAIEPTSVPYRKHMTLLDLMIAVGGMTEFAAGNSSVLVRTENGTQQSYGLRLDDLIKEGDISADLALMPGDIIIISESWF